MILAPSLLCEQLSLLRMLFLNPIMTLTCFQLTRSPQLSQSFVAPVSAFLKCVAGTHFKMSKYLHKNNKVDQFKQWMPCLCSVINWIQVEENLQIIVFCSIYILHNVPTSVELGFVHWTKKCERYLGLKIICSITKYKLRPHTCVCTIPTCPAFKPGSIFLSFQYGSQPVSLL